MEGEGNLNFKDKLSKEVVKALGYLVELLGRITDRTDVLLCAGGFVRDTLLEKPFSDIDLAIEDAYFDQMAELVYASPHISGFYTDLNAAKDSQGKVELLRFVLFGVDFDLKRTCFGQDLQDDIKRRDFTINALYMNPFTFDLVDPMGYRQDVINRTLRGVRKYGEIFIDRNRIIRAFRFKHKGYVMEDDLVEYLHTGGRLYMKAASDHDDLQRFGGELRKCFSMDCYKEVFDDLVEGGLLNFWSSDKKALLQSAQAITVIKEVFETKKWVSLVQELGVEKELEETKLVTYALAIHFMQLYQKRNIKKSVVRKTCQMFLNKAREEEVLFAHKKFRLLQYAADKSARQAIYKGYVSDCTSVLPRASITTVILLPLYIPYSEYSDLTSN